MVNAQIIPVPIDDSIWWNRGLAIFIALLALMSGFSAIAGAVFDFGTILQFIEASTQEFEEPIPPGNNASEEEIQRYEEERFAYEEVNKTLTMMRELDERNISQKSVIFYGLTFLLAIPTVALIFTKHEYWLQIAIGWCSFQLLGAMWLQAITMPVMSVYYEDIPSGNLLQYSGFASSGGCGLFLYALIAVVYLATNEKANQIPDSAFHRSNS